MKKYQVSISLDSQILELIVAYELDLETIVEEGVIKEVEHRVDLNVLSIEILGLVRRHSYQRIGWSELKRITGVRDIKKLREAAELAHSEHPGEFEIQKQGIIRNPEY